MPLDSEIVVVSGLPRSGTSLLMQMLERGGIPALTDGVREPDIDNPRGYCELERVKRIREDATWLPEARGKVIKMISSLLYGLPDTEMYRIVFMERDMEEILESQEKMLRRLERPVAPRDEIRGAFAIHLERIFDWLGARRHMRVLKVSYNSLLENPPLEARRIAEFLDERPKVEAMLAAIDASLYRNRKTGT